MADSEKLPEKWFSSIEKSREKAKILLKKVVAIDLNTSVVVGKLDDVAIDKLFKLKYPFCKLTLSKARRYRIDGKLETIITGDQVCFVNKPKMIMDMDEFSKKFPNIHEDIHVEIRRGRL